MTTDTPSAEALADKLAAHSRWRRGDDEPAPDPTELGKTIDATAAALRSLASERDALRNDSAALQHALVGNTGASAIQRAASLVAERAEADKIISNLRAALDAANKQSVPALSVADSQKLSEAKQLARNMVSHPVAFSTIDHVEEAGNTIMELLAALDAAQAAAQAPSAQTFDAVWPSLVIPGEFDGMDQCDQSRWRGVLEQAFNLGRAAQAPREVPRLTPEQIDDMWEPSEVDYRDLARAVEARVRELCGVAP